MKESWPKAVEVLAQGGTSTQAAKAAQVTVRTIRRWRNDEPRFADSVDDTRSLMLAETAGLLAFHTAAAARKLGEIIEKGADHHQLRAAQIVLAEASRYRSDRQIEDRVQALELAVALRQPWD